MKRLSDLLANHPIPGVRLSQIRHICAEELKQVANIAIDPRHITFKEGKLSLTMAPVLKSALLLRIEAYKAALASRGVVVTEIQ